MVVDSLVVLGKNRFGRTLHPEAALAKADQLGVDVIVGTPARPDDYHLEPVNSWLAETAAESGGRMVALGRVDPLNGDRALREAERCLDELGCVGLFLHPHEEAFPITTPTDLWALAQERGVPVVIATGYFSQSEPLQVAQVAERFPALSLIMTNGGQINISGLSMADAWLALKRCPNLFVTTNGEYRQDFIEQLAAPDFDPRRVLYCSFAPYFDPRFELRRIRSARMSAEARSAVEGDNAARLFGLTTRR